jgi:hypothetical protein
MPLGKKVLKKLLYETINKNEKFAEKTTENVQTEVKRYKN